MWWRPESVRLVMLESLRHLLSTNWNESVASMCNDYNPQNEWTSLRLQTYPEKLFFQKSFRLFFERLSQKFALPINNAGPHDRFYPPPSYFMPSPPGLLSSWHLLAVPQLSGIIERAFGTSQPLMMIGVSI